MIRRSRAAANCAESFRAAGSKSGSAQAAKPALFGGTSDERKRTVPSPSRIWNPSGGVSGCMALTPSSWNLALLAAAAKQPKAQTRHSTMPGSSQPRTMTNSIVNICSLHPRGEHIGSRESTRGRDRERWRIPRKSTTSCTQGFRRRRRGGGISCQRAYSDQTDPQVFERSRSRIVQIDNHGFGWRRIPEKQV